MKIRTDFISHEDVIKKKKEEEQKKEKDTEAYFNINLKEICGYL